MQIGRTGEVLAKVALAAQLRHCLAFHVIQSVIRDTHRLVRLHIVSDQKSRTKVRTHAALLTRCPVDFAGLIQCA